MLKLIRYVKKYGVYLIIAVVLLFGQAISDLNLPNMMGEIVTTGIQNGGIEEISPKAISQDGLALVSKFMTEDEIKDVDAAYTPFDELSSAEQATITKTFPNASEKQALVYTATTKEAKEASDKAFSSSSYALVLIMQDIAKQSETAQTTSTDATAANSDSASSIESDEDVKSDADDTFDAEKLEQMLPMLQQLPAATIEDAMSKATDASDTLTSATAVAFNKAFYKDLGADTDAMQNQYIMKTGGLMILISFGVALCAIGAGFCFSRIGAGVARDLRRDVYGKVSSFNNEQMDRFSVSSLITRTTNDITQVQTMYTMGLRMLIYAPVMGIGGVIMALRKSTGMSWIIALAVIIMMGVIAVVLTVVMPKFSKMQSLLDRLSLVARENLSGIMVVRAFSNQEFQEERFDDANKTLTKNTSFVNRSMALLMPIMMLLMNVFSIAIIWLGSDQIAKSTLQLGDMMAYMQYAMQIIMSFLFIAMIFVLIPRASVSAGRINEVLESEDSVQDPSNPKTFGEKAKGIVEFKNVCFRYKGAEEDVLHDISFKSVPGQTTAFIGATGSGKSSVVNLVPRFYDVTKGSITIDGVDIRDVTQHELRQNIGYVPQKGLLFSGTIESNLKVGDEDASQEQIEKVAAIAQATEFISGMDEGYESPISQGGTNVSGGQRQRLSIARALVKDAPVYVFDDSFSALDFATDAKLREALHPYTKESTVLLVAQRVSTIMHADQIVVLDEGKVAGIGRHEDLLKTCETYRQIAESQLSKEELS